MCRVTLPILIVLFGCTDVLASQVIFKNGDRITGVVTASGTESLTVRSPLIGDVVIPWNAVERVSIEEKVHVPARVRREGQRITRPQTALLQGETPKVYDFLRHWSGSIDPGFTLTEGNSNTRTFSLAVSAARSTAKEKISLSNNWVYANTQAGGKTFNSAKTFRSGVRYDVNLNDAVFVFGSGDWEYDKFQKLDLRNVLGSGFGWHAVKQKKLRLDLLGGGNFNREYFSTGVRKAFVEANIGQEANYQPNTHLTLKSRVVLIPNLTVVGHYRAAIEASVVTGVTKYLGWQVTLTDRYTSLHLPAVKPNDLVVTTGLRVNFSR